MRAAVMTEKNNLEVLDVPDVQYNEYQALVKISHCSICNGTDRSLLNGTFPPPPSPVLSLFPYGFQGYFPGILGHESVGEVVEVGSKVTRYKKGDIVLRAGACYQEEKPKFKSFWGGFAEYGIVDDVFAYEREAPERIGPIHYMQQVVPKNFDRAAATQLITIKEALSSLQGFGLKPKESVLIWGDGPVGLSFMRWAKIMGAYPVIQCGHWPVRLELAEKLGADFVINQNTEGVAKTVMEITDGKGVDKVVNAIGSVSLVEESLDFLADGGAIGIYGIARVDPTGPEPELNLNLAKRFFHWHPWSLVGINPDEASAHQQAIDAVEHGLFDPNEMITHVLPLDKIAKGMELIAHREALKVVIEI